MATYVLGFDGDGATEREIVGGKAASLGKLSGHGFPVPPGFTVRTDAYLAFLGDHGMQSRIAQLAEALDYEDAAALEQGTAQIRDLIIGADLPVAVTEEIRATYGSLIGESSFVAVRSSGTAEDMAEASFAGLHDTYLNIRGIDELLVAVRRCWSSMWTARATAYRQKNGLDHLTASIAVVVQQMVDSEISGVLFTANPLTARVDELVVNSAWGLGEGIVSGILTPDEYRVETDTLAVRKKALGTKAVEVVRDPETGVGTVTRPVDADRQNAFTLDDTQVADLGDLGRRVEQFYEGIPQDIEWGYADGTFYLLQSRDITGVEFTWDEHVDAWQWRKDDTETLWSNTWSEQFWTGAITPLFYSIRSAEWARNWDHMEKVYGFTDLSSKPWFRYRRATAYWNISNDEKFLTYVFPQALRASALTVHMPEPLQEAPRKLPFDLTKALRMQASHHIVHPEQGVLKFFDYVYDFINNRTDEATPDLAELRRLSDRELRRRAEGYIKLAEDFCEVLWSAFFVYGAGSLYLLGDLLGRWYTGDNPNVYQDLLSGLPTSLMAKEQHELWDLAVELKKSPELVSLLRSSAPAEFFARLEETEEGRAFKAKYDQFLADYGHRGHADRDMYYSRRCEDPSLDYNSLRTLVGVDLSEHPTEAEGRLQARRQQVQDEVAENIRKQPFGGLKAEAFKAVANYAVRFLKLRDDERWYIDKVTFCKKVSFDEMGRRLRERGVLVGEDDHYFLAQHELYHLMDGGAKTRLIELKINNRRNVFQKFLDRDEVPPRYMQDGAAIDFTPDDGSGGLRGVGTSRGLTTGRARIVPNLSEIGRVEKGDILICNATDPGWAPVFMIISGLVLETGGMLAHGACLSREYGLPAVQIAGAMRKIEDGAMISVNGETGEVTVLEDESQEEPAAEAELAAV